HHHGQNGAAALGGRQGKPGNGQNGSAGGQGRQHRAGGKRNQPGDLGDFVGNQMEAF
ncbi:unnamed protein product, partial [Adineta steineri]